MHNIHQGFLLTRSSRDINGKTEITFWLSTVDGPVKLIIENEKPLFFVLQQHQQKINNSLKNMQQHYQWKSLPLKTFSHQPVAALYFSNLYHFYNAQKILSNTHIQYYEADLRLHERYLMERFVYGSIEFTGTPNKHKNYTEYHQVKIRSGSYVPTLRMLSLDLECSYEGELFSIGFYSKNIAKGIETKCVFMIGEPESIVDSTATTHFIQWVSDEKALLQALEDYITEQDPDIIIGWNVINFDFRLLLKRAELHHITLKLGRDKTIANWRDSKTDKNQGFISLPGRVVIDGIDALKTATYNFPSFSLENVAQTLLGRGKKADDVDNRIGEIIHNFRYNKQKLAVYNLEDCILVWDIFEKTNVLDFLIFRTQLTGLDLDKQGGSVAAFSNLYLPLLHRAGFIAPNLPDENVLASPGGYVMSSKPGLYRNVLVLDFKSLYPSIIRTFKIDPVGLIEGLANPKNAIEGFRGGLFARETHFLPEIIRSLWQQRDAAKKHNDQPRSQAIKIIMNSFYGVLGSGGCRFYDTRLASSITMRGHEIMQQTAKWIEQLGYEVIYGDTDSTFVLLDQTISNAQARKIGQCLAQEINNNWQHKLAEEQQLECYLEIEFETHFSRFLMPTIRGSTVGSKKRYAGLIENSNGSEKLVFKGLETIRTDWTELAKLFQQELFQCLFHDQDPSVFICELVAETLAGKHDHQLIYRKRLRQRLDQYVKNVPPHVRAARLADEQNLKNQQPLQYQNKGWISYVMTNNGPETVEYQTNALDYEHYIEKQLQPIADAILPFAGISFEQLINAQLGLF